ncbi:HNH endonuclease [Ornithinimicrobium sp. F0845]|uniref:HNH endonuclease n=1 Tax=Ornithinimicrobium sp. F0845 TaxID=2926412 RepID=UPI001FF3DCD0|nr:HNH endonuclease signature motif containing protein [Ornithinimicrobium sp. F0845]MCK0114056.1 HNH endonuclease [Ornithinimicrobium sp. F0845]
MTTVTTTATAAAECAPVHSDASACEGDPVTAAELTAFTRRLAGGAGLKELVDVPAADLCDVITGLEGVKNAAAAAQARVTDTVVTKLREQAVADGVPRRRADKGLRKQLGLARRESPHAGSRHIGFAQAVVHEMPNTHAAMTEGRLTEWAAMELVRETACLTSEQRSIVDARLADRLRVDSQKALVAAARALAYELDPYAFTNRGRKAAKDRRVTVRPAPDVMSIVSGYLPVAQGVACYKALDESARSLKAAGDERSLDQLRADLFMQRLTGQCAADNSSIELGLVMTDKALLGLGETAARLQGFGPIPAPLARDLVRGAGANDGDRVPTSETGSTAGAASAEADGPERQDANAEHADPVDAEAGTLAQTARVWLRRLYADAVTGVLTGQDQRRRLFSGPLRRFLVARDQVCRTPWCDAPVRHADHVLAFARGGATTEHNGEGTCEACNYDKEAPGWRHETIESRKGLHIVRVTTPTGHTYESHAPPLLPTLGLSRDRPSARAPVRPEDAILLLDRRAGDRHGPLGLLFNLQADSSISA